MSQTSRDSTRRRWLSPRRLVLAALGVAVVGSAAAALRPEATPVETAVVRRAPLRVTVDAEGRTRVRDRFVVTAPVAGRLDRIPLREGDVVRVGDVVARLAPAPLDEVAARQARARLDAAHALAGEAETRIRLADAALAQARRDAERARRLLAAGAIAPRALEEAELAARAREDDAAAARAHAAAARADVAAAAAALMDGGGDAVTGAARGVRVVRAPTSGRVLRLAERSERVVAPGAPIVEIGDTRGLEVVVDVLSSDAARIGVGMPVLIEGSGAEAAGALAGRVRRIEGAAVTRVSALGVEEQRVDVLVDVPDAPATLGDGYRVDARIVTWVRDSVLTVPTSALVRDGDGWAVYAVADGRALLRRIAIGRMGTASAQVAAGLREGERVVVFPSDKLASGTRVAGP